MSRAVSPMSTIVGRPTSRLPRNSRTWSNIPPIVAPAPRDPDPAGGVSRGPLRAGEPEGVGKEPPPAGPARLDAVGAGLRRGGHQSSALRLGDPLAVAQEVDVGVEGQAHAQLGEAAGPGAARA